MTSELKQLYQEVIIDHGKNPRNFCKLSDFTHSLEGYNPLCGDQLTLYIKVESDKISDVSFEGQGCAISMACASLMTSFIKGKTVSEAEALFKQFQKLLTSEEEQVDVEKALGKLAILAGVKDFPMRVKCATLAWHTLHGALNHDKNSATTE